MMPSVLCPVVTLVFFVKQILSPGTRERVVWPKRQPVERDPFVFFRARVFLDEIGGSWGCVVLLFRFMFDGKW